MLLSASRSATGQPSSREAKRRSAAYRAALPASSRTPDYGRAACKMNRLARRRGNSFEPPDAKETRPFRSEERRVGKERVRTCRSRWTEYNQKKRHSEYHKK